MRQGFSPRQQFFPHSRRGSLAPAVMMALVVVISAVGLILDRLWLQTAHAELLTAAESAALGAGRHLVNDDLLRTSADAKQNFKRSRKAAVDIAAICRISGERVLLDGSPDGDIRFGRLLKQKRTGQVIFVETSRAPTSVVVRARHTRALGNPVVTFFNGLTGIDGADVAAQAEATIDNRIPGFEPLDGAPIPILPIAIHRTAPEDSPLESWRTSIDQRAGRDEFRYDESTGKVSRKADGIPEITLRLSRQQDEANAHVIVPQPQTTLKRLARQIATGWNLDDLPDGRTQLRIDGGLRDFQTVNGMPGSVSGELPDLIGQCRIVLLYDEFTSAGHSGGRIRCTQFAAGRILNITHDSGTCEIVFQPGVLTTRSAILADDTKTKLPPEQLANRYVYKLRLTH